MENCVFPDIYGPPFRLCSLSLLFFISSSFSCPSQQVLGVRIGLEPRTGCVLPYLRYSPSSQELQPLGYTT